MNPETPLNKGCVSSHNPDRYNHLNELNLGDQDIIAELDHDEDESVNLIEFQTEGEASSAEDIGDSNGGDDEYEVGGLSWEVQLDFTPEIYCGASLQS